MEGDSVEEVTTIVSQSLDANQSETRRKLALPYLRKLPRSLLLAVAGAFFAIVLVRIMFGVFAYFLDYLAVSFFVLFMLFVPGFIIASRLLRGSSTEFLIVAAPAFSVAILAIVMLLSLILCPNHSLGTSIFSVGVVIFTVWLALRNRPWRIPKCDHRPILAFFLLFLFTTSYVALPIYPQDIPFFHTTDIQSTRVPLLGGDPELPYRTAQFLLNRMDPNKEVYYGYNWLISDRTPLMGIVTAFFLSALGVQPPRERLLSSLSISDFRDAESHGGFWIFRIVGGALDSLIVLSAFALLTTWFNRKIARISLVFLVIIPFVVWNVFYTSPKSMAAYFILLCYYLITRPKPTRSDFMLAGFFVALGFLSHSMTTFYVIGAFAFGFLSTSKNLRERLRATWMVIVSALTILPWMVWTTFVYAHPSKFLLYPITVDIGELLESPNTVLQHFLTVKPQHVIWIRAVNALRTLIPFPLTLTPQDMASIVPDPVSYHLPALSYIFTVTYLVSLPGALSLTLWIPAYTAFLNAAFNRSKIREIVMLVVLPMFLCFGYFGYLENHGLAMLGLQPLIPIGVGYAISLLAKHGKACFICFFGVLVENMFLLWISLYPFQLLPKLLDIDGMAFFALILLSYLAISLWFVKEMRSSSHNRNLSATPCSLAP